MVEIEHLQSAYEFCMKRLHIKTPIKLEIVHSLDGSTWAGSYCNSSKTIKLKSSLELHEAIKCLFHEFVHCHQYNIGKLKDENGQVWKGKTYDNYDYWESPWEINARKYSSKLFNIYFKSLNKMYLEKHGKTYVSRYDL